MQNIIIRPLITEKSISLANGGKYTFIVSKEAGKSNIKLAVEEAFGVTVLDIVTSMVKGKTLRTGKRRTEIVISPVKKAIVKIAKDQKIDLFELAG